MWTTEVGGIPEATFLALLVVLFAVVAILCVASANLTKAQNEIQRLRQAEASRTERNQSQPGAGVAPGEG